MIKIQIPPKSPILSFLLLLLLLAPLSQTYANDEVNEKWWPSPWGPDDEQGALNFMTKEKTIHAASLIRKGEIIDMAHTITPDMPSFHHYTMKTTGGLQRPPSGTNRAVYNGEHICGHITGLGTQIDALGHAGQALGEDGDAKEIRYYNGFRHSDISSPEGFTKLSVDRIRPFFTRGILINLVNYKERNLEAGEHITIEDLIGALKAQGMSEESVSPGDALFLYTGFGRYWDTEKYGDNYKMGSAGLTEKAAHWLADKGVISVGSDQPALEPDKRDAPNWLLGTKAKGTVVGPIHEIFLVKRGIYIFENVVLEELAQKEVYEFAFAFATIPFKGALASTVRPFAIH